MKSFRLNSNYLFLIFGIIYCTASAQSSKICDSLLIQGRNLLNKKEHLKSLEIFTQAYAIAEENRLYNQQFLATNNIGINYYLMFDYGEALDNYMDSYKIAVRYLEPKQEMIALNNISGLYFEEKNYEKAEEYLKKAYQTAKDSKDDYYKGTYSINLADVYNKANKPELAKKYLNEALNTLQPFGLQGTQHKNLKLATIPLSFDNFTSGYFFSCPNF